uniref:Tc1-like transposase DDE domain-containing protein n=1 Tax=Acrobeloides nanus TaxID=290746 RepID=A0A914EKN8_9BILA
MFKRGKKVMEISRELGLPHSTVSKAIKRFNELGISADRKGRGRKKTARTPQMIRTIKRKVQRGEDNKRKMAREEGISERTVRRIVKEDMKSKSYKKQEAHFLDEDMMKVRKQRLRRFQNDSHRSIVFSNEKMFTIEEKFNKQNNQIIARNIEEANQRGRIVKRRAFPKPVMVWAAITSDGKSPLVFVEPDLKVKSRYYREQILNRVPLPWARRYFGRRHWCFQQDGAPSHKAEEVQNWIRDNFSDFISVNISKKRPGQWPPNSPDLNPLDYAIWGILETAICGRKFRTIEELKAALQEAWERIDLNVLASSVDHWRKRLRACVQANRGYFEI